MCWTQFLRRGHDSARDKANGGRPVLSFLLILGGFFWGEHIQQAVTPPSSALHLGSPMSNEYYLQPSEPALESGP